MVGLNSLLPAIIRRKTLMAILLNTAMDTRRKTPMVIRLQAHTHHRMPPVSKMFL